MRTIEDAQAEIEDVLEELGCAERNASYLSPYPPPVVVRSFVICDDEVHGNSTPCELHQALREEIATDDVCCRERREPGLGTCDVHRVLAEHREAAKREEQHERWLAILPPIVEPGVDQEIFRIRFASIALDKLRHAAGVARDGLEWGGHVYAASPDSVVARTIRIFDVAGHGPDAIREARQLTHWVGAWAEELEYGGITIVGGFHTHSRHVGPSDDDRASWQEQFLDRERRNGQRLFVALIVSSEMEEGWSHPQVEAFVLRRALRVGSDGNLERGRVICERARIEITNE
jgi:hypothetical protein